MRTNDTVHKSVTRMRIFDMEGETNDEDEIEEKGEEEDAKHGKTRETKKIEVKKKKIVDTIRENINVEF